MMQEFGRNQRVACTIQQILAAQLQKINPIKDDMLTLTRVRLSNDLRHASVYITSLKNNKIVIEKLNQQMPYYRAQLAKKLAVKYIPKLEFLYDEMSIQTQHINDLIENLS